MYLNEVKIIGNLTKDPELKSLPNGTHVSAFSIATNRTIKDASGAKKDIVEFHNCVAFGKTAELIYQYMKKGNQLFVTGRLQTRSWDGEDGKKNYRTEIIVNEMQFGNNPKPADGQRTSPRSLNDMNDVSQAKAEMEGRDVGSVNYPNQEINPEDIPF